MPVQLATTTVPRLTPLAPVPQVPSTGRPADARFREHTVEVLAGNADATAEQLHSLCAEAIVGDTVHLTGPENELLQAAALLRESGFEDSELTLNCTTAGSPFADPDIRRVNCCHCRTVFTATVTVGAAVDCPGCGRGLVVYHHFSRRTASYLAYTPEETL